MSITIKGGNGAKLAELIKKLSNASSVEIGWNAEARYPGGHRNGGDFVANVAVINEFGGTAKVPAHTQSIYRSIDEKSGTFKRGAQFVKSKASNYETIADVAEHTVTIPPRPFFRTMIAKNKDNYGSDVAAALKSSSYDAKIALGLVGQQAQEELAATIDSWASPGNAKRTIDRKGKDDPLNESGQMRKTVNHWVK